MATGDDALAAGMEIVPGTADRRQGYDEINKTRDYVARRTAAVTPIAKGGTGSTTAADARTALGITALNIPRSIGGTVESGINDAWNRASSAITDAAYARSGVDTVFTGQLSPSIYSRAVSGNSVYISSGGLLGHLPSARRFKKNIGPAGLDAAAIRAVAIRAYQYKVGVGLGEESQVGVIAEELEALGLGWLVGYTETGETLTVHYDRLALIALALAQDDADRLDALEARLTALETP